MVQEITRIAALCALGVSLSACGGGGGGGGSPATPFTSISDLPETGTVEAQGIATTATIRLNPNTGDFAMSNISGTEASTLRLRRENGEVVGLVLTAPESSAAIDVRDGGDITRSGAVVFFDSDARLEDAILVLETGQAFEHQTLGVWLSSPELNIGTIGAGAYGAQTPAAGIPRNQTATYAGESLGRAVDADGLLYLTTSGIEIRTDFQTTSLSSTGTIGFEDGSGALNDLPEFDFSGGGPVTGSGFTAVVSGPATLGVADGRFHGPNAEEVGGTYSLTGANGVSHIGAFGAN